jgi:FkbM family methyltransferase
VNSIFHWLYLKRKIPSRVCSQEQLSQEGYSSQYGQDKYIVEDLFKYMPGGFFIDIGANDGVTLSNTYVLEKRLGWSGIAIEPIPRVYEKLKQNRSCLAINACISEDNRDVDFVELDGNAEMLSGILSKYDKRHLERIEQELVNSGGSKRVISVPSITFNTLCKNHNVTKVDYLNIDTEGAEFDIIKSIDFSSIQIGVITVENNYVDNNIHKILSKNGFELVAVAGDEIYLNSTFATNNWSCAGKQE